MFIPRIGMEVVVSFVGGDPDKPLVTGCVYNGLHQPFHELPTEKTKSYLRTSSSPGGGGYNELLFEDKKGEEEVYLHAQKDHREEVEHNHSKTVKSDRSVSVGGNESYSVTGTQAVTVTKKRTVEAKDDEEYLVRKNQHYEVGEKTTELYHGGRERTVEKFDNTTVEDANKNTTVKGQYNIEVSTHFSVKHGESNQLLLNDVLWGSFKEKVEFKVAGNRVVMDGQKITMSATKEIVLQCGAASLTLKQDGTIELVGAKKVSLGVGPSSVAAEPQGVTISGPTIKSSAVTVHEIVGAMVKIG
jgi:type VI secretion system secreted protein VgrG